MGKRVSVRWQAGTFNLIADRIRKQVKAAPDGYDCTVDAIILLDDDGEAQQGFIRLNNESGEEVFAANIGWPCPGPGCPDE